MQFESEEEFSYKTMHTLKQLSENSIFFYTEKPLALSLKALEKKLPLQREDCLTERSNCSSFADSPNDVESIDSPHKKIKEFDVVSQPKLNAIKLPTEKGFVFENTEVLEKIDRQYNLRKGSGKNSSILDKKK